MATQKFLIHDFANLVCSTREELKNFCFRHGLLSPDHRHLRLRGVDANLYFSPEDYEEENARATVNLTPYEPRWRMLRDSDLAQVAELVKVARNLLEISSNGEVPHVEILALFQHLLEEKGAFTIRPLSQGGWKYQICANDEDFQRGMDLESRVMLNGILVPILDPNSPVHFEWTKKCAICGNFYQAKGPRAIFCSEKCRSRARAIKSKEAKK